VPPSIPEREEDDIPDYDNLHGDEESSDEEVEYTDQERKGPRKVWGSRGGVGYVPTTFMYLEVIY